MNQINYDEVRATLTAAGYTMSPAGSQWTPSDQHAYLTYSQLHWPLLPSTLLMGQAYSCSLPETFPGHNCNTPEPGERTLLSIAISGPDTVVAGQTILLTAMGTYSAEPLTMPISGATWVSDDEAVATVANGAVSGVAAGSALIGVAFEGVNSPDYTVTVEAASTRQLQSIAITGPTDVESGQTSVIYATGTYNEEPLQADVSNLVTWTSDDETVATVAAGGVVTGVEEGDFNISASLGEVTSPAYPMTVTPVRIPQMVQVNGPETATMGTPISLMAISHYDTAPLSADTTASATWAIEPEGALVPLGTPGDFNVTVAEGNISVTATVNGVTSEAFTMVLVA